MKSEQQKLEKILAENDFLDNIFRNIQDGIVLTDQDGIVTFINPSAEKILGRSNDEITGQKATDIPISMYTRHGDRIKKKNKPFDKSEAEQDDVGAQQVILQRPDGKTTPVLFNVGRTDDGQMTAIITDISDMLRRQQQMEEYFELVAHDLRTPLTGILGHAEMIEKNVLPEESRSYSVSRIRQAGDQMLEMIEGITERMRIEQGNFELKKRQFNLADMVRQHINDLAAVDGSHQYEIDVPDTLSVHADYNLMHRALSNLVGNAAKYSPENSRVSVRGWTEEKGVIVTVTDRGYGIEHEDLNYIFDPYFLTTVGQDKGGIGLGLNIAYQIVKAHEGNIFVSSRKGEGTTFSIFLPHPDPEEKN